MSLRRLPEGLIGAVIYKTNNTTITGNSNLIEIEMGTTEWASGGCTVSPTTITVPKTGKYDVKGCVWINSTTASPRAAAIRVAYSTKVEATQPFSSSNSDAIIPLGRPLILNAGDYVHLWAGIGDNTVTATLYGGARTNWLSVVYMGPA